MNSTVQAPLQKSPAISRKKESASTTFDLQGLPVSEYVIEKSLGKGVFGEVLLAKSTITGEHVALKRIPKGGPKFNWKHLKVEVEAGRRISNHKNIASMETYFETINNFYIVFEFVEGIDLFGLLESRDFHPLEEKETKKLMAQIVDALIHCHNNGVAHRDIKLDNLLVDWSGNIKLIDFGLCSIDEDLCTDFVGSPEYVAPEVIQQIPHSGYKADVFSLGMVLYCMLFGQFPFIPDQRLQMVALGLPHPTLEWPDKQLNFPAFVSKSAKELLIQMLEVDPTKRISMEEVKSHKWFSSKRSIENIHNLIPEGINVC
jgi:serine/threonine protein kinase